MTSSFRGCWAVRLAAVHILGLLLSGYAASTIVQDIRKDTTQQIEVCLTGKGAHRHLKYNLSSLTVCLSGRHTKQYCRPECSATVEHSVPAGVFLDPYQLATFASDKGISVPDVRGPVDLESPEQDSEPQDFTLHLPISSMAASQPQSSECIGGLWRLQGDLFVPVHSRYPAAQPATGNPPAAALSVHVWRSVLAKTVLQRLPYPTVSCRQN
mmetsp:Transcript_20796/g.57737  ORF Transcript_20796/g.57737 Transcript_20796/m.57737 type:complete len:212 (+) Transcript_20796:263-898(+)